MSCAPMLVNFRIVFNFPSTRTRIRRRNLSIRRVTYNFTSHHIYCCVLTKIRRTTTECLLHSVLLQGTLKEAPLGFRFTRLMTLGVVEQRACDRNAGGIYQHVS